MVNKSGFTLIELLVVIVIIGILSGIGVASFGSYIEKYRKISGFIVKCIAG